VEAVDLLTTPTEPASDAALASAGSDVSPSIADGLTQNTGGPTTVVELTPASQGINSVAGASTIIRIIFRRPDAHARLLILCGLAATGSAAAQVATTTARTGVVFESYSFGSGLAFDRISELTIPVTVTQRFSNRLVVDVATAYASASVREAGGKTIDYSGLIDTDVRPPSAYFRTAHLHARRDAPHRCHRGPGYRDPAVRCDRDHWISSAGSRRPASARGRRVDRVRLGLQAGA